MEQSKSSVIFLRFLRGFVAGGIASVIPLLAGVVDVNDPTVLKKTLISLGIAFVTGGIQALDKLLRWQEPEKPVEIQEIKAVKKRS